MDELKEKLKFTDCPFNWDLSKVKDRKSASFIIDRLLEKDEEISEPWCHACILLTLSYLHSENGDYLKAVGSLKEGEELISKNSNDLIVRYKTALQTVYHASKAVYLSYVSTPSEVQQFYEKIVPIQNLSTADQAAVSAIKANVFLEFGVSGSIMASQYAKEAIQKNPTEADWHFLMGKLLARIRHFGQDHDITPAELSHLQTAFNLNHSSRAAIYLANCYIEKTRALFANSYKNGNRPDQMTRDEVKKLTSEAKKLIQFALDINKNQCVHILIRCAFALTKLPRSDRDFVQAKQLLNQSLERSPSNPMANKLAGDICLQEDKPLYHKALKHFEAAAAKNVYSANFSIFEIQVKLSLNKNPEMFYAKMIEQFTEKNYQLLTLLHATEYYLFIRRDLLVAIQYFLKAISLDKNFHALTDRWVKYVQKNVNLYELIGNEARYAIREQMYSNPDQMKVLQKVCQEISDIKPELMRISVVPNKVQMYLDTYQKEGNNVTRRGRDEGSAGTEGRGRGRGRGGRGRGRGRGGRGAFIFQKENISESSKINFPEELYNRGRGNNRMAGASRSRNRSSSRNRSVPRIGENDQRCLKTSENIHPTYFDKTQFDRITYSGNQFDEVMENPYFIKFLELKYKKLDNSESFREWLLKYNGNNSSNPRNEIFTSERMIVGKSDDKLDILIGMINHLKEEINEIKLNDSRSCYSYGNPKKCHSLKSLQCNMIDRIKKPEECYSELGKKYKKAFLPDKKKHRSDIECRPDYFRKVENFHYRMPSSPRQEDDAFRCSRNKFHHEYVDKKKRYIRSRSRDSCSDCSLSNSSRKSDSSFKYSKENRGKGGYDYDRKQNYHSSHYRDKDINKACSSKGWRVDKRHSKKDYEGHYSSSSSDSSDSRSHEKSEEREYYNIEKLRYHRQMHDDLKNKYGDKKGSDRSERRNERKSSCKDNDYYVSRHHKKRSDYKSISPQYTGYDDNYGNEDSFRHGKIKSSRFVGKNEGNDSCLSDSCQSRTSGESHRQKKEDKINPPSKNYSKKNRMDKHSYERMSESKKELHSENLDSQTKKFYDVERANDRRREKSSVDENNRNENDRKRDSNNKSSGNVMLEGEHFNRKYKSSKKSDLKHKPVNLKNEELTVITKQGETPSHHENTSLSSSEEEQLCGMKKKSDKVKKLDIGSSYKRETSDVETRRKTGNSMPWNEYVKTSSG